EDEMMFCSDDKHPDNLVKGHINELCRRAVQQGIDVFKVLKAACINPVKHYKLNTGLLKERDFADFIITEDLVNFKIHSTYINGQLVAKKGISKIETQPPDLINNFNCSKKNPVDFRIKDYTGEVIEAVDGELITGKSDVSPKKTGEFFESDVEKDILKIV